jgi:hypothetical protein
MEQKRTFATNKNPVQGFLIDDIPQTRMKIFG